MHGGSLEITLTVSLKEEYRHNRIYVIENVSYWFTLLCSAYCIVSGSMHIVHAKLKYIVLEISYVFNHNSSKLKSYREEQKILNFEFVNE